MNVNLSQAMLKGCDFTNTNLRHADLRGTELRDSHLKGADLFWADLEDSQLQNADLSLADLTFAKLRNAYLYKCELKDASLGDARMEGVSLLNSRPWRAQLWPRLSSNSPTWNLTLSNRHTRVKSIDHFLQQFNDLKKKYSDEMLAGGVVFYFRGESRDTWNLTPSVMRTEGPDGDLRDAEAEMLVDLRSRRAEDFLEANTALDEMVIARHYGLPTRLLDVSRNPLVALFNACEKEENAPHMSGGANRDSQSSPSGPASEEDRDNGQLHVFAVPKFLVKPFNSDTVSVITNFARLRRDEQNLLLGKTEAETVEDTDPGFGTELLPGNSYSEAMNRLYQFIRLERPSFAERIRPRDLFSAIVVEPQQSFERIRAQSGAFLISAFHERFEERCIRAWCKGGIPLYHHYTFTVPREKKRQFRDALETFNITRETMLPGLDEAAQAVKGKYSKRR